MEFSEIELQSQDIMWFGVDCHHRIFECTTGGIGNLPTIVRMNKEECHQLELFFTSSLLKEFCDLTLFVPDDNDLTHQCVHLSKCGIYCFDVDYNQPSIYHKLSEPAYPLKIESLPENIRQIISKSKIKIDVDADIVSISEFD